MRCCDGPGLRFYAWRLLPHPTPTPHTHFCVWRAESCNLAVSPKSQSGRGAIPYKKKLFWKTKWVDFYFNPLPTVSPQNNLLCFWVLWRSLSVTFPFPLYTSLVMATERDHCSVCSLVLTPFALFPDHLTPYRVNILGLQFWSYLFIYLEIFIILQSCELWRWPQNNRMDLLVNGHGYH